MIGITTFSTSAPKPASCVTCIKDRAVVVVYLEAQSKSWPAWRKAHGDKLIPEIIATVKKLFAGREVETVLSGHSGGGSFIFGYLNAVDQIPDDVVRIAFLDSNYAYDRALGHKEKLSKWLTASDHHYLCVLAYNDAVALLNGKSFVSAAGGTWGKSHAMQRDLAEEFKFTSQTNAEFQTILRPGWPRPIHPQGEPGEEDLPHRAGGAERVHPQHGFGNAQRGQRLRVFRPARLLAVDPARTTPEATFARSSRHRSRTKALTHLDLTMTGLSWPRLDIPKPAGYAAPCDPPTRAGRKAAELPVGARFTASHSSGSQSETVHQHKTIGVRGTTCPGCRN